MSSGRFLLIGSLVLLSVACSRRSTPQVGGSESHWLAECSASLDCGGALECICGACTRLCSTDDACAGDVAAGCYDRSSQALVQRCEANSTTPSAGVCLRECLFDPDCPDSLACIEGVCVPRLVSDGGVVDAGSNPDSGGLSREELEELLSKDTEIDFSTPVTALPLQDVVTGGDERITGTWVEEGCDPAKPADNHPFGCVRLTLARDDSGTVTGTFQIDRTAIIEDLPDPVALPPAEDPDVGYPVGVDPALYYQYAWNPNAGIPYRVLDGLFDDGRLTFKWSLYDLWRDWCALQTSYRWMIGDHAFSFCVPQDRALWEDIDEGKIALCTSADFEPLCSIGDDLIPCPCVEDTSDPRCSPAYCQCDDTGCDASLWHVYRVELLVEGDAMTGVWKPDVIDWGGTLRRLSP